MSADLVFQLWPQLRDAAQPKPIERRNFKGSFIVADEWSKLAQRVERGEFRLRAPATTTRGLCGPIVGLGPCLEPLHLHGDEYWIDPNEPAQCGDVVLVQWHPDTLRGIIERGRQKPEWLETYGEQPTDSAFKLLRQVGNDYWLVTRRSMLPLGASTWGGENKILGVVRYCARNGVPIYGSGELIAHQIDPNAATDSYSLFDDTDYTTPIIPNGETELHSLRVYVQIDNLEAIDTVVLDVQARFTLTTGAPTAELLIGAAMNDAIDGSPNTYGATAVFDENLDDSFVTPEGTTDEVIRNFQGSFSGITGTAYFGLGYHVTQPSDGLTGVVVRWADIRAVVVKR
jgi:hypothetical protein